MDLTGPSPIPEPTIMPDEVVPPPRIATIDELMASHAAVMAKENADRATLEPLINPTSDAYRPQLFVWAAAGFPNVYVIRTFNFIPPSICSDGTVRDLVGYVRYLLGVQIEPLIAVVQSMLTGIIVSYSIENGALRIHVTKA